MVKLVIQGPPRTKKTSNRLIYSKKRQRHFILPSKNHQDWHREAMRQICGSVIATIDTEVQVTAAFYREANRGDLVGYMQALGDLLQDAGIIRNDVLIKSWDGSRLLKDAINPRIELTILPMQ